MNNVVELHERETSAPSGGRRPYIAYGLSMPTKVQMNLDFHRNNGDVFRIDDTVMHEFLVLDDEAVCLLFNKCSIELLGRNLPPLFEITRHFIIRFVEVFDPARHHSPADHEPLITRIRWKTVWQAENRLISKWGYQSDIQTIIMD